MDINTLKQMCIDEIDKNKDIIMKIGRDIYENPELSYREFKATNIAVETLKGLGIDVEENIAVTGCKASINQDKQGPKIAILGELDALSCPEHKDSKEGGAIHCCGHNAQMAGMLGCAIGLVKSGAFKYLDGKIDFMAVPAEEGIELEYRKYLQDNKMITYVGGKQELIHKGYFDDVDMSMMFHLGSIKDNKKCIIKGKSNGFIEKGITFIGKSAHSGGAPHLGINAGTMANLAINNINALRDTFKDEDKVRVHYIINHGGDAVNVVPNKVTMEAMVRANNAEAMIDANKKFNRALEAAALAIGGKVIIEDFIGYLSLETNDNMNALFKDNLINFLNIKEDEIIDLNVGGGSTDMGDISQIMPCIHPYIMGATGDFHTKDYNMVDEEMGYINSAKAMALTLIDLLYDNAKKSKEIIDNFKPTYTVKEYLKFLEENNVVHTHDYTNI